MTNPQSDGLLTAEEQHAVHLAGELAGVLGRVVGQGPSRHADLAEIVGHVHGIQRAVLAQAAARAFPGTYRLLGESIDITPQATRAGSPWSCADAALMGIEPEETGATWAGETVEPPARRRWWHRHVDPTLPLPHLSPCRPGSTVPVDYDG